MLTLAHNVLDVLPYDFAHSTEWKLIFWAVLLGIVAVGSLISVKRKREQEA